MINFLWRIESKSLWKYSNIVILNILTHYQSTLIFSLRCLWSIDHSLWTLICRWIPCSQPELWIGVVKGFSINHKFSFFKMTGWINNLTSTANLFQISRWTTARSDLRNREIPSFWQIEVYFALIYYFALIFVCWCCQAPIMYNL